MATSASLSERTMRKKSMLSCENTYITEPKPEDCFSSCVAEKIIRKVLEEILQNETYDFNTVSKLTCKVADTVKNRLKDEFERYKLVCHVMIGQPVDNVDVKIGSRCVWNDKYDTYASGEYINGRKIYGAVTVYAVYFE